MTNAHAPNTALVTGACALVSGATGFLGSRLAATLAERGYRVRALVRSTSDLSRLSKLGVEVVVGDVGDRASLLRAAAGQRVVFHTAGLVTDWGPAAEFMAANRDGTANVIAACQAAGVSRLVHISSLTVLDCRATAEGSMSSRRTLLDRPILIRKARSRQKSWCAPGTASRGWQRR